MRRSKRGPGLVPVLALALAWPALGGCERAARPEWIHLANAEPARARAPHSFVLRSGKLVARVADAGHIWLEVSLEPGDWAPVAQVPELWRVRSPIRGHGPSPEGAPPVRLLGTEHAYAYAEPRSVLLQGVGSLAPGSFTVTVSYGLADAPPNTVLLRLDPGSTPPAGLRLQLHVAGAGAEQLLRGDRFSGEALSVLPGEAVERRVDVPPRSTLRFATALESAVTDPADVHGPVSFQARVNGRLVFEHREGATGSVFAWHAVPLGDEPLPGARIRFEVAGDLAHTAVFAPVVGPCDVGRPGARPWGRTRPDLVVFLADTLRADVLGAYGSTLGLTPQLDRIAAQSLVFRRAWSPATFTQASHAALFSGYFARQVAAHAPGARLPAPVVTLAERLSAAGYRTGAITDALVVSERFGFAQGFEWFDEHYATLASTLERALAFLDADDGRPVFLFVQSYRVHNPYRVSDRTRREAGDRFHFAEDSTTLENREAELSRRPGFDRARDVRHAAVVEQIRNLYRGAVIDLDREVGPFHAALEERGWLGQGVFVFTSDHGEAFSEHDQVGHGGRVWEEQTRIPLFLQGPGIEPGVVDEPVSLLDLTPTLAGLAGVAGEPDWPGVSLLPARAVAEERADRGPRPIFVFESRDKPGSTLAIVEAGRKVIAYEDAGSLARGERFGAFDLAADPGERDESSGTDAAWAAELLQRLGPAAADLLRPRARGEAAELGAEQIEQLRALGYVVE